MSIPKQKVKHSFSTGEEIANSISHGVAALLAIVAMILLIVQGTTDHRGALYMVSVVIYSFTLMFLFLNSCIYHALVPERAKDVYRRFDHLSIYLLIAGSYTPFCLVAIGGTRGIVLCCIQWTLAIVGVVVKSIWVGKNVKLHTLIFILMGWMALFVVKPLFGAMGIEGFALLFGGGLAYTIGTLFYIFNWFKYHHLVWHIFVVIGAVLHFLCIYIYV